MEAGDFHCRNDHLEGFFTGCANRGSHLLNVAQHLENGLVETEVSYGPRNFAAFHKEQAVACHARQDLLVRIDFTNVPEARNEKACSLWKADRKSTRLNSSHMSIS